MSGLPPLLQSLARVSLLAASILISACGGGSSSSDSASTLSDNTQESTVPSDNTETANSAPELTGNPASAAFEGSVYLFQPVVTDADDDVLFFSIQNRPSWASFDSSTGRLWGEAGAGDAGTTSNIQISVSDGSVSVSLPAFSITVNSAALQTGSAVLNWAAPVARADGSALAMSEITGYTVYYGTSAGHYPNSLDISDASDTSVTITNLPLGTYYMVLTTRDSGGRESSYSSEVVKVVS